MWVGRPDTAHLVSIKASHPQVQAILDLAFDFVIVVASLVILIPGADSMPGISSLGLLKPLRIFRLFKRVPSLKALMEALGASIPGEHTYIGSKWVRAMQCM